jgi:hypothetical protein
MIYYWFYNSRPLVLIPSQLHPSHDLPTDLLKTNFNITLPPTPRSSKWCLFLSYPHQNPVSTSPRPDLYHIPHLPHYPWLDHPNNIWFGVTIMKLFVVQFHSVPLGSTLLGPNIFFSIIFSNALSLHSSCDVTDQVSHSYKTTCWSSVSYSTIRLQVGASSSVWVTRVPRSKVCTPRKITSSCKVNWQ